MDEKKCENCLHFILYYTNRKGLFKPLGFGHCVCERRLSNRKKQISHDHVCEFWENNQAKQQEKLDSIEHALCRMADDINHYIQTLNKEKRQ